jgi:hypothetical protein
MTSSTLLRLALGTLFSLGVIVAGAIVFVYVATPPSAYSRPEVSDLVDRLNHEAAIQSPHLSLGKSTREAHLAVFETVESGLPLTEVQSAEYRQAYQSILRSNQWYLALFDSNLTVVHDHGMAETNNVGSIGIVGDHDHHDFSARSNLNSLRESLTRIEDPTASGLSKVFYATRAHKDLTDIILHMATAPQTKSTPYHEAQDVDELGLHLATLMRSYKAAQFDPVNSPDYTRNLHAALVAYDSLVLHVQSRVTTNLSAWQRVAAGRWLGWQSFGPNLDDAIPGPLGRNAQIPKKGN